MRGFGVFSFLANLIPVIVMRAPDEKIDPEPTAEIPEPTGKRVEQYAVIGGSDTEIADRFDIETAAVRADFERVLRTARAAGKLSVRRAQWDLAMKGNGPMLIWLGRNMLGQSLNPQTPGEEEPEFKEKNG